MVGGVAVGDYFELSLVGLIAPGCRLGFLASEMPDFVGSAGFDLGLAAIIIIRAAA